MFQPPVPPSYTDDTAVMSFRRIRRDAYDTDDDDDNDNTASIHQNRFVQHPIVYLQTSKGTTIPAAYFHQPNSHYTILFSHGNGEDLGITASYVLELSNALNTSVLCYDYSGYGLATGKPSEANCYADIRAAHHYLTSVKRIPPNRILLFGRSLGSGPTIDLAVSLGPNLGGIVLIAALSSCVRVVFNNTTHTPRFDMFANIDKIRHVCVPIFCVHGMMDDVVPFNHGLQLSRAARFPLEPLWIRAAGHNNLESPRFQYEVFLRYMKAMHQFRRWQPPVEPEKSPSSATTRRRDSFGALVKVAGCFGPRNEEQADGERWRRRGQRISAGSQTLITGYGKDDNELRALWDDGVLRRGSDSDKRMDKRLDRRLRPAQARRNTRSWQAGRGRLTLREGRNSEGGGEGSDARLTTAVL